MQENLVEFRMALFSGDWDTAERMAYGALQELGENAIWLNELGQLYFSQGRFSDALQCFDRAIVADPWKIESLLNGAIVLSDLGLYEEATQRYQAACALDNASEADKNLNRPVLSSTHLGLAAAKSIAEKIIELSQVYCSLGQLDNAIVELQRAREVCDCVPVRLALAQVYMQKQECEKATVELENARRLEPQNAQVHVAAAQCYLMMNRSPEAREALSRASVLSDKSSVGRVLIDSSHAQM